MVGHENGGLGMGNGPFSLGGCAIAWSQPKAMRIDDAGLYELVFRMHEAAQCAALPTFRGGLGILDFWNPML